MRVSTSTVNFTPSSSPTAWASSIMARITARVPAWAVISSRVAQVNTLTGLNETFPHSLSQMSSRILGRTGALNPEAVSALLSATTRSDFAPSGSPNMNRFPVWCRITPGSTISQDG